MDDAAVVRDLERLGDLGAHAQRLLDRQRAALEPLGERLASTFSSTSRTVPGSGSSKP
jgi:hypothetical protein